MVIIQLLVVVTRLLLLSCGNEPDNALEEVVVTALGVVDGIDAMSAKSTNAINALQGKVAWCNGC